jgi:hypothetical protein
MHSIDSNPSTDVGYPFLGLSDSDEEHMMDEYDDFYGGFLHWYDSEQDMDDSDEY